MHRQQRLANILLAQPLALLLLILSLPTTGHASTASSSSERDCTPTHGLCLTSFRWCSPDSDCSPPPEGGYIRGRDGSNAGSRWALLLSDRTYNISWTKDVDAVGDSPVRVTWRFSDDGDSSSPSAKWEINTTDSFYLFHPSAILSQFPTSLAPDLDPMTASALATADFKNYIEITRAEDPPLSFISSDGRSSSTLPRDISLPFTVQDSFITAFFDSEAAEARHEEYGKWKLGVGIGVGLGVPVLMGVAGLVGWRLGRWGRGGYVGGKR